MADEEFQARYTEFMMSVGMRLECPVCLHKNWVVSPLPPAPHIPGVTLRAIESRDDDSLVMESFVPALSMICGNCGFMRIHSLAVFEKWESSRRTEGGETEDAGK